MTFEYIISFFRMVSISDIFPGFMYKDHPANIAFQRETGLGVWFDEADLSQVKVNGLLIIGFLYSFHLINCLHTFVTYRYVFPMRVYYREFLLL